jgi:hypothetical protein
MTGIAGGNALRDVVAEALKDEPQRLKPGLQKASCGMAEAMPLRSTAIVKPL